MYGTISIEEVFAHLGPKTSPLVASNLAWDNRFSPLPSVYTDLSMAANESGVSKDVELFAAWCCARRIHFAFAHHRLLVFCSEALEVFPNDELLNTLASASLAVLNNDAPAWSYLMTASVNNYAEGLAPHILLTSVVLSPNPPDDVLKYALSKSSSLSDSGDLIATYRKATLLRRMHRFEESLAALDKVNEELIAKNVDPVLFDHLSERVITERHLVLAAMSISS